MHMMQVQFSSVVFNCASPIVSGVKDFVRMFHQHKKSVNEKRAYATSQHQYWSADMLLFVLNISEPANLQV